MKQRYFYKKVIERKDFEEINKIYNLRNVKLLIKLLIKKFINCEFFKNKFSNTIFKNCIIEKTVFNTVSLNKTFFLNCKFKGVEFSHMELSSKYFQIVNL